MATLYQQLAASIQEFSRIVDEAQLWTEGADDQTFTLPGGRVVNSFAKSVKALEDAAAAIPNLPADLASDAEGKGASLVSFESGLTVQQYLPALNIFGGLSTQFLLNPPAAGYYGDGITDCTAQVQAVLDQFAAAGGGDIYFPRGDYALNITIAGAHIRIFCEKGTVLRPANSGPVIDILDGADNIEITGPAITGQLLSQEGTSTTPNVKALHCIRTAGTNVTLRQFSTKAAREDGIYIQHAADMDPTNLTLEDFYLGSTSRNPATLIAARNTIFRQGTIRLDDQYAGNVDVNNGYALFDLEPNSSDEKTRGIRFEGVTFINACSKSGAQAIIFGENYNGTDEYDIVFDTCHFAGESGQKPAAIRLSPASNRVKKLNIRDLVADQYVFINTTTDGINTVQDSAFQNITLGYYQFTYYVTLGTGCVLENIKSTASTLSISGSGNVDRIINVMGHNDVFGSQASTLINGVKNTQARGIDVGDTSQYTDIVSFGKRGTVKITIGGSDASSGNQGMHISETWLVMCNDTFQKVSPNIIYDAGAGGLNVRWNPNTSAPTLQIKPNSSPANQYVVQVEVFSRYQGAVDVDWLI